MKRTAVALRTYLRDNLGPLAFIASILLGHWLFGTTLATAAFALGCLITYGVFNLAFTTVRGFRRGFQSGFDALTPEQRIEYGQRMAAQYPTRLSRLRLHLKEFFEELSDLRMRRSI